jgi:uncharacterized lipoprotein YmbA
MAIQVTGYFKNPTTQMIVDSPVLFIQFHGLPKDKLVVDVNIMLRNEQEELEQVGAFPFNLTVEEVSDITKTTSNFYAEILNRIQEKLVTYLPTTNITNSTVTLNII